MPVLEYELGLRAIVFAGILGAMSAWEWLAPRRERDHPMVLRWRTNLGLIVIGTALLRWILPVAAVGSALWAQSRHIGLFNWADWPAWLEWVLAIVLLDLCIYWQHVATHRLPWLWRLHRVHHADRDLDVSSGVRFHPLEVLLSMLYKMLCVVLLGPAAAAVILFELILNGVSLFNHANVRLPSGVDRLLRLIVVTPDMHRVHHSVRARETDSNFGFCLPFWDRLFGSYRAQPGAGHNQMNLGLTEVQDARASQLRWTVLSPLNRIKGNGAQERT
ncbi:MAG: sterol desaturase family protein [Pseudomonadota bacterium]